MTPPAAGPHETVRAELSEAGPVLGVTDQGDGALAMFTLTDVADWLGAASLLAGALLSLAAAIGVLRFPDTLSRMHAATKPQVLGVLLLLLGVALRIRTLADLGMVALVGIFQMVTAPVSAQMVGRAAYRSGRLNRDLLDADDLADR